MSATVTTTIDIDATPRAVWDVLIDFPPTPVEPVHGPRRRHRRGGPPARRPPAGRGGRGTTFRPVVLVATSGEELRWVGRLGPGGLFDGVHSFVLSANPDGTTRLTHAERFTGILVPLVRGATAKCHAGFKAFNDDA